VAQKTRVLFATDLHGSTRTFRKYLNALNIYKADVGIIGGDLTGKLVVPIIKQPDGTSTTEFNGLKHIINSEGSMVEVMQMLEACGYYWVQGTSEEMDRLGTDRDAAEKMFETVTSQRLESWCQFAKTRLKDSPIKVFITGGNDDLFAIDDTLTKSDSLLFTESKIEHLVGDHEMISTGYSNITPWKCPRDIPEEELYSKLDNMAKQVSDLKSAIFNIHVPPHGTTLDVCTKLDTTLDPPKPIPGVEDSAGSTAVRDIIAKYQPLVSLHGHIHESRGVDRIGRTTCLNPGSEYAEGMLRSVAVNLEKEKVSSFQFLSG